MLVFNQFGDLERCSLHSGNAHSATAWRDVQESVMARYRGKMKRRYFRGDAGHANPGIYGLLKRPVGRPPHDVRRYYAGFSYQAASWTRSRQVVAKVE